MGKRCLWGFGEVFWGKLAPICDESVESFKLCMDSLQLGLRGASSPRGAAWRCCSLPARAAKPPRGVGNI